jgi:hypothetical protein
MGQSEKITPFYFHQLCFKTIVATPRVHYYSRSLTRGNRGDEEAEGGGFYRVYRN